MPRFEKGNIQTKSGRPKGAKDKKQFSLTYWFRLIIADYTKLTPSVRTRIALECWKTLVNKAKQIPSDPDDSTFNADNAMGLLKQAEQRVQPTITKIDTTLEHDMNKMNDDGGPA